MCSANCRELICDPEKKLLISTLLQWLKNYKKKKSQIFSWYCFHLITSQINYFFIRTICCSLFVYNLISSSLEYSISIGWGPKPFFQTLWLHASWFNVAVHLVPNQSIFPMSLLSSFLLGLACWLPVATWTEFKTVLVQIYAFSHLSLAYQGQLSHHFKQHWPFPFRPPIVKKLFWHSVVCMVSFHQLYIQWYLAK